MTTAEIIRKKRDEQQISQLMLAEYCGISRPMVAQIERGTKTVSLPLAKKMASYFGCTIDELAG